MTGHGSRRWPSLPRKFWWISSFLWETSPLILLRRPRMLEKFFARRTDTSWAWFKLFFRTASASTSRLCQLLVRTLQFYYSEFSRLAIWKYMNYYKFYSRVREELRMPRVRKICQVKWARGQCRSQKADSTLDLSLRNSSVLYQRYYSDWTIVLFWTITFLSVGETFC